MLQKRNQEQKDGGDSMHQNYDFDRYLGANIGTPIRRFTMAPPPKPITTVGTGKTNLPVFTPKPVPRSFGVSPRTQEKGFTTGVMGSVFPKPSTTGAVTGSAGAGVPEIETGATQPRGDVLPAVTGIPFTKPLVKDTKPLLSTGAWIGIGAGALLLGYFLLKKRK